MSNETRHDHGQRDSCQQAVPASVPHHSGGLASKTQNATARRADRRDKGRMPQPQRLSLEPEFRRDEPTETKRVLGSGRVAARSHKVFIGKRLKLGI